MASMDGTDPGLAPAPDRPAGRFAFASGLAALSLVFMLLTAVVPAPLRALVEGVVVAFALTAPGFLILSRLNPVLEELPSAFVVAGAFLLSVLAVGLGVGVALTVLPATVVRVGLWIAVPATVFGVAYTQAEALRRQWRATERWERWAGLLIAGVAAVWLLLLPLSPYPGQSTEGLADPPSYTTVARSLAEGEGWEPGYFVGDFRGGSVPYVKAHPLPAVLTAALYAAFGISSGSFFVVSIVSAALALALMLSLVLRGANWEGVTPSVALALVVALVLCAVPAHARLFGLGAVTAPLALALLVLWGCEQHALPSRLEWALKLASGLVLIAWRPEGAVLAVFFALAYALRGAFTSARVSRRGRIALGFALAVFLVVGWLGLPALGRRVPAGWRGLGIFYVHMNATTDRFEYMYDPWQALNYRLELSVFGPAEKAKVRSNPEVFEEIRARPGEFVRYVAAGLVSTSSVLARTLVGIDVGSLAPWELLIFLLCLVRSRQGRLQAGAFLLYLACLPLLNVAASERHLLPLSCVLLVAALRALPLWELEMASLRSRRVRVALALASLGLFAAVAWQAFAIAEVRRDPLNAGFVVSLAELRRVVRPGEVVAVSKPPVVTWMTGLRTLGGTNLGDYVATLAERAAPDLILLENATRARNYSRFMGYEASRAAGPFVEGYAIVVHDAQKRVLILRRIP